MRIFTNTYCHLHCNFMMILRWQALKNCYLFLSTVPNVSHDVFANAISWHVGYLNNRIPTVCNPRTSPLPPDAAQNLNSPNRTSLRVSDFGSAQYLFPDRLLLLLSSSSNLEHLEVQFVISLFWLLAMNFRR